MAKQIFIIPNHTQTVQAGLDEFHKRVDTREAFSVTFAKSRRRTLDQNGLFHVWLTEFAAYILKCHTRVIEAGMLELTKERCKHHCYLETNWSFLISNRIDVFTKQEECFYTSSASWSTGEMHQVLNWLQMHAGRQGLILESIGEHKTLKDQSIG